MVAKNGETIQITKLLIASSPSTDDRHAPNASIGVVVQDRHVFWGDCLVVAYTSDPLPTIQRLVDLVEGVLVGRPAGSFRELSQVIDSLLPPPGRVPAADGVRGALQQALLQCASFAHGIPIDDVLRQEFGLSRGAAVIPAPVFLEVSDYAASVELIDRMLAMRPTGIAYRLSGTRVIEAIGDNAELLQQFVRDLGERSDLLAGRGEYKPAIYIGANGAFGKLAGDVVRNIGKVLSICIDLQQAAGDRVLIMEDPILLDHPLDQAAQMQRLKGLLYRSPSTQSRTQPAYLVQSAGTRFKEELAPFVDTEAVNGFVFEPISSGDIAGTMKHLAEGHRAGMTSYIRMPFPAAMPISSRWLEIVAAMTSVTRSAGILLNVDEDTLGRWYVLKRQLDEIKAWEARELT